MGNLLSVLIADHLQGGEQAFPELSRSIDISVERLVALQTGKASPILVEVATLADFLDVDPIHLFRSAPSVQARRTGEGDNPAVTRLLDEVDSFIATYAPELRPSVTSAFSARSRKHARAQGALWGSKNRTREFSPLNDPLLEVVEDSMQIPVVFWPISNAPAGSTVDFTGTIGIWINSHGQSGARQRFTLAHEIAHILLRHVDTGSGSVVVDFQRDIDSPSSENEALAGACASEILLDKSTIKKLWQNDKSPAAVASVAANVGMSYQATLIGLEREGYITRAERDVLDEVRVKDAFEAAGAAETYFHFESQRNQRRLPGNLPSVEHLNRVLEQRLG